MSLINDALRKARQEAAEQEAEKRGVSYQPPRAHLPAESKLGQGLLLGVLFGGLAAALGGAVVWWLLDRGPTPTVVAAGTQESTGIAEPVSSETPVTTASPGTAASALSEVPGTHGTAGSEVPGTTATGTTAVSELPGTATSTPSEVPGTPENMPVPEVPGTSGSSTSGSTSTTGSKVSEMPGTPENMPVPEVSGTSESTSTTGSTVSEVPGTPSEVPGTQETAPSTAAAEQASVDDLPRFIEPPERVGEVAENTYVLEAKIGDVELSLDFIVWSESDPLVQINGKLLAVGQLFDGWMVTEIQREQVTLRSREDLVTLRVR